MSKGSKGLGRLVHRQQETSIKTPQGLLPVLVVLSRYTSEAATLYPLQDGTAEPAVPPLPGGGNLPIQSHLGHVADSKPDGTVQNRLQRSSALDEGRFSGTGSRHS